jgi:hypothetical protein
MKRVLFALLLAAGVIAAPVDAAKPAPSGTIVLNETGPLTLGDTVTFTTTVTGLKGSEWPMVYVRCVDADGVTLYGQLDHPETVFVLGGGWSPWRDTPWVDAVCQADIRYFNVKHISTVLAVTPAFDASGA